MLAASSPSLAERTDDFGVPLGEQWSDTLLTLVTWNTCALLAAPGVLDPLGWLIVPEPDTPAWPTLPVPAPVCALVLAAPWSVGFEPALLMAAAPFPGWPVTWICSPMWVRRSLKSPDRV